MNHTSTEPGKPSDVDAEFRKVMRYVTERARADGLEEDVMAALFDVLDDLAQRNDETA